MKRPLLITMLLTIFGSWGAPPRAAADDAIWALAVGPRTDAPVWLGAEADLTLFRHFSLSAGYGYMPEPYSSALGSALTSLGGNSAFGNLTKNMLASNRVLHAEFDYRFSNSETGWFLGVGAYRITTQGQSNVIDLVQDATGLDLSALSKLLAQNGASIFLNGSANLYLVGLHAGYSWRLVDHLGLQAGLGVFKVVGSSVSFSSNSSAVDSLSTIQSLYSSAESQVKSALASYGYLPTVSLSLRYSF